MRAGDPLRGDLQVASPTHLRTSLTHPRGFMVERCAEKLAQKIMKIGKK